MKNTEFNSDMEYQMVSELVSKAHISYTKAKQILEECNWSMTDAMIYTENEKKGERRDFSEKVERVGNRLGDCCKTVYGKAEKLANDNSDKEVVMFDDTGRRIFGIPVIPLAFIFLFFASALIPITLILVICGYKFRVMDKSENAQVVVVDGGVKSYPRPEGFVVNDEKYVK